MSDFLLLVLGSLMIALPALAACLYVALDHDPRELRLPRRRKEATG